MKKSIVFVSLLILATVVMAKEKTPDVVLKAFNAKYSKAEKVDWDQEDANEWEAEFKMDGVEMSASFDALGTWLETEKEIKKSELPAAINSVIEKDYSGYKIEEAVAIDKPDFSGYEVELEKGETTVELVFSKSGDVISKKEVKEEDEKEEKNRD